LHTTATAIVASKLAAVQVSFVGHGYDVYATPADLALKLKHADFAVAVCAEMKLLFEQLAPNTQVFPIACGIDPVRYSFTPKPSAQCNGRLLFVGRLTEKKGLATLLTALSAIPASARPSLDIVGSGHLESALKSQCKRLHVTDFVNFLGNQTSEWIIDHAADYLALCAPFCEAENGDRDTGPLVVKEAMALGLPVITTAFMGCKEMLDDRCGFLVTPNRIDQLHHAIVRVQHMQEPERLSLLIAARERLETLFTSARSGRQLATAVEGVLS
jgi:glycosyltransferase involved in cell wall biosynthesis